VDGVVRTLLAGTPGGAAATASTQPVRRLRPAGRRGSRGRSSAEVPLGDERAEDLRRSEALLAEALLEDLHDPEADVEAR
jgi:hypothetical protein